MSTDIANEHLPETAEVVVDQVAHGGHGLCRINGAVCFVPGALPGDRIRVRLTERGRGALWGRIDELLEASPDRVTGGRVMPDPACPWLEFAYPAQGEWKRRIVKETFARVGRIETEVDWLEDPALRVAYRTRAQFQGDGKRTGFYEPGTHTIVPAEESPVLHPRLREAAELLQEAPSRDKTEIVVNPEGEDVLVWRRSVDRKLRARFPQAQSPLDKKPRQQFVFEGVPIVNGTFTQASLLLNRLLVRHVQGLLPRASRVLELYCGNGNLTLGLPEEVDVIGFDHNLAAVKAASKIGQKTYRRGREEDMRTALLRDPADTIVLDPPREGAKRVVHNIPASKADTVVYVSCDAATLARDAAALVREGFTLSSVTAIDMYPQTPHVEAVALLTR